MASVNRIGNLQVYRFVRNLEGWRGGPGGLTPPPLFVRFFEFFRKKDPFIVRGPIHGRLAEHLFDSRPPKGAKCVRHFGPFTVVSLPSDSIDLRVIPDTLALLFSPHKGHRRSVAASTVRDFRINPGRSSRLPSSIPPPASILSRR